MPNELEQEDPVAGIWAVRAGRGAAYASDFLVGGFIAVSFGVDVDLTDLSWEEVSAITRKVLVDETSVAAGLAAGAMYRLAAEFREGDFIITPERGGTVLAGVIAGSYRYLADPPVEDYRHSRPVRWFARLDRSELPATALSSLRSIMTLFQLSSAGGLLELLRSHESDPDPSVLPAPIARQLRPAPHTAEFATLPTDLAEPAPPSGSEFETDKRKLLFLLEQIRNRDLALPDFQRSFVWESGATRELIVSIVRGFPAGNLLFLRGGDELFFPRAVEGAPLLGGHEPTALILDGQQRLSSLYQAFAGVGTHRFFLDVAALMRGEEVDGAIKAFSTKRALPWSTIEGQARALMFPLSRVGGFSDWRDEVLDTRLDDDDERRRLRSYFNRVEDAVLEPIRSYQFPLTTLNRDTPSEAVCTIFETLNRTGIKLSVFELVCARAFAEGHRLREGWHAMLATYPILEDFEIEPYYVLQAVALRLGREPKRGVVVSMDIPSIVEGWDAASRDMARGLEMLRDECGVLTSQWLPYAPMLPTLAAAWRWVDEASGAAIGARRLKLQRWFWCASFLGDYDNAPNSRATADVPLLGAWLQGGDEPRAVADFAFDTSSWLDTTVRQRGLYRSTMALALRRRPLDFHNIVPLTRSVIESTAVDDHHVFPRAYLKDSGVTGPDTILNHTLIDKLTNIRIGAKAPSVYLGEIRSEIGDALDRVLQSHCLPETSDGPLWTDDYDAFLEWRLDQLERELEDATGAHGA